MQSCSWTARWATRCGGSKSRLLLIRAADDPADQRQKAQQGDAKHDRLVSAGHGRRTGCDQLFEQAGQHRCETKGKRRALEKTRILIRGESITIDDPPLTLRAGGVTSRHPSL